MKMKSFELKRFLLLVVLFFCVCISANASVDDLYVAWQLGGTYYLNRLDAQTLGDLGSAIFPSAVTHIEVMPTSGNVVVAWDRYVEVRTPDLVGSIATYDLGGGNAVTALGVQSDDDVVVAWGNSYIHLLSSNLSEKGYVENYSGVEHLEIQADDDIVLSWVLPGYDSFVHLLGSDLSDKGYIQGYTDVNGIAVQSDDDIVLAWSNSYLHHFDADLLEKSYLSGYTEAQNLARQSDDDVVFSWALPGFSYIHLLGSDLSDKGYLEGYTDVKDIAVQSDDDIIFAWGNNYIHHFNPDMTEKGYVAGYTNVTAIGIRKLIKVSDLNSDGIVNFLDFAEFSEKWFDCTDPDNDQCDSGVGGGSPAIYNIDVSATGTVINQDILGQNAYTKPDISDFSTQTYCYTPMFELTYNSLIRGIYPGLSSETYIWNDLVGFDTTIAGQFGWDTLDYLRWARNFDSELMLQINTRGYGARAGGSTSFSYTNTSDVTYLTEVAADWVRYCNFTVQNYRQGDTVPAGADKDIIDALAAGGWDPTGEFLLKADESQTQKVKYWEIGNEPTITIDGFSLTSTEYVNRYIQITNAMTAVDSNIMVGPCFIDAAGGEGTYMNALLSSAAQIDFLSYHPYGNMGDYLEDTTANIESCLRGLKSHQIVRHNAVIEKLIANGRSAATPLFATEWNPDTPPDLSAKSRSVAQGLACAETIFTFAELQFAGANFWCWPNYVVDGVPAPYYLVAQELRDNMGDILVDSYYDGNADDSNFRLYTTKDSATGKISVWAINFSSTDDKIIRLSLDNNLLTNPKVAIKRLTNTFGDDVNFKSNVIAINGSPVVNWRHEDANGVSLSDIELVCRSSEILVLTAEEDASVISPYVENGSYNLHLDFDETAGTKAYNKAAFASNDSTSIMSLSVGDGLYNSYSASSNVNSRTGFGKAVNFDGLDDYVSVADGLGLRPNCEGVGFSIQCWFNADVISGNRYLVEKRNQYSLYVNDSGNLVFNAIRDDSVEVDLVSDIAISSGTWHNLDVQYNPLNKKWEMYIDGSRVASSDSYDTEWNFSTNTYDFIAGSYRGTSSFFDGKIDEVRIGRTYTIYDAELMAAEAFVPLEWWKPYELSEASPLLLQFNELSGTVADNNSNSDVLDGTYTNTDASLNIASGAGIPSVGFKRAFVLDGLDDYVLVSDDDDLVAAAAGDDPTVTGWAIECWVKLNSVGNYMSILNKYVGGGDNPGNRDFMLDINTSGKVWFFAMRSDGVPLENWAGLTSLTNLEVNQWYHVAAQYNSGTQTWQLYVNGTLEDESDIITAWSFPWGFADLLIGAAQGSIGGPGTSQFFDGVIDEVRISKKYYLFGHPDICGYPGTVYLDADLNKDCYVDIKDLAILADEWL